MIIIITISFSWLVHLRFYGIPSFVCALAVCKHCWDEASTTQQMVKLRWRRRIGVGVGSFSLCLHSLSISLLHTPERSLAPHFFRWFFGYWPILKRNFGVISPTICQFFEYQKWKYWAVAISHIVQWAHENYALNDEHFCPVSVEFWGQINEQHLPVITQ